MLNNPDEVARMSKNAKEFVKKDLNSEIYYRILIEIYNHV
jgi:hypothetical protein